MKNGKNALYRRPIPLLVSVKMIASLGGWWGGGGAVKLLALSLYPSLITEIEGNVQEPSIVRGEE